MTDTLEKIGDISSLYMDELTELCVSENWPRFRAGQIFGWLHEKRVSSADEMTNVPKAIREKLAPYLRVPEEETRLTSKDGTVKHLFRMYDGQMIETVYMPYSYGNSVCISSQAGCAMGCAFCASTIGGCVRNLTAGEMLGQVYQAAELAGVVDKSGTPPRISNIVVMGTGEPMQNYDNLIRFIRLISDEHGYNLSTRGITVSTCGIVENIRRLAGEGLPVTLALSLHAPNDELRRTIMPVANRYTIAETLDACSYYFNTTGRRISIEYSLMRDVNDSSECAGELGALLKNRGFHVNLIPINPVFERDFTRSPEADTLAFKKKLEKYGINVTIRKGMGRDIDAACGQLRRKYEA